jgi:hypothetical protein
MQVLHLAAAEGNVRLVELLLGEGAEKNKQDRWGMSPFRSNRNGYHFVTTGTCFKEERFCHRILVYLVMGDPPGPRRTSRTAGVCPATLNPTP